MAASGRRLIRGLSSHAVALIGLFVVTKDAPFVAHGLLHLKGAGISSGDAAWAMGLLSIAAVGGRLIGGWLMDRLTARLAFAYKRGNRTSAN